MNSLSECPWMPKEKHYRLGMLHLGNRISESPLLTEYQGIFELIGETFIPFHSIPKSSNRSYQKITIAPEDGIYGQSKPRGNVTIMKVCQVL